MKPAFMALHRVAILPDGAFGVLLHLGVPFAVTLERTYGENDLIKIPTGIWRCVRTRFIRGGYDTYEILVPGHSRLLFHIANQEGQLDGCIAVAESFAMFDLKPGIAQSRIGFVEFMNRAANAPEFDLEVA